MENQHSTKTCEVCSKELVGSQTKYCSRICHNKSGNYKFQNYQLQQARAHSRKKQLIEMKGGSCEICGYSRNIAALCFHHRDPSMKETSLDGRKLSNSSWERILQEASKCILLCHNCHMEIHFPHFDTLADPAKVDCSTTELTAHV